MHDASMEYFTHQVQDEWYGAWYRQLSATELEVIGTGFIKRATYGGYDALAVARSVLENFVLCQKRQRMAGAATAPTGDAS